MRVLSLRKENYMKVQQINGGINFQSARLNMIVSSDNHGNLTTLPEFFNAIEKNKDDIFQKAQEPSTLNLFINAGDFFINPSKKGFLTSPKSTNGAIQKKFLGELIEDVKGLLPKEARFDALYTPGNHCFDGGDKTLFELISIPSMTTVLTNLDKSTSKIPKNKLVESKHYQIPDSEDPNYKHHVLVLGVTIPTMKFYNPGLLKDVHFVNDSDRKDTHLNKENLTETFGLLKEKVDEFKEKYPNGIVMLNSHMGTRISKMIRDEVGGIDEIFDAHQHDCSTTSKGNNRITSLGKDNEIVKLISLEIEKNGDIERETDTYFTKAYELNGLEANKLKDLLDETFQKDVFPIIKMNDPKHELTELELTPNIRYANSHLANYLTSAIKRSIREVHTDISAVGLQSSIIRGGIKDNSNNLELMKVFDGVSEDLSGLKIGNVKGEDLVGLIVENIDANIKSKKRNTIIHWSDIQVNRTLIGDILAGKEKDKTFYDAVKFRINAQFPFEKIDPNKDYKIAIADKYLVKDDIKYPAKIRDNFVSIGKTYDALFRQYLESTDYNILITDKTKENRVL